MENRLSMEIMPTVTYTNDCIEITDIVNENLLIVNAIRDLTKQHPISKEDLELIRGIATVKPVDLLMTRRVN